ncbi:MAG: hypothetical protein F4164_10340 [Gemmatimonadales bacterium]|nr:hypothetical protein [Gemmatimonadales bacterium]MYG49748.1 hypothetical protein [Gemmatimonadales bacterium]MYK01556.1 hypothetical protein [Candidatus Palauibacter ramosifaciens]
MDRPEYGIFQAVVITTRNLSDGSILRDWCGATIGLVRGSDDGSRPPYLPRRRCGPDVTTAVIRERADRIGPRGLDQDTLRLPGFVVQGFYRANVWLLAPDGALARDMPFSSGMFSVFPSQN